MDKPKILIVDDDENIAELISLYLNKECFDTKIAGDGETALTDVESYDPDLILLDLMLPGMDGYEVCQQIRRTRETPIIMLSAKGEVFDKVLGLKMGADDYIIKPFDLDEVLVRIEVVLRRSESEAEDAVGEKTDSSQCLEHNGLVLNKELNSVTFEGSPVKLTLKELQLLELFLKNPKKTFTKANLYETVWEDTYYYEDNTVNVHMSNLRSKLKKATGQEFIETVWGIGYKLNSGASVSN